MTVLRVENISKKYIDAGQEYNIFQNVNFSLEKGDSALLLGNSGCGKSTFLQIAGLIQAPTGGKVFIEDEDCTKIENDNNDIIEFSKKKAFLNFFYKKHFLNKQKKIINKNDDKINFVLKNKIGFIYQFHYLFNDFSAKENLIIPQLIRNVDKETAEKEANRMLDLLKLSHRSDALPNELSGGERQRIAIARAIIKKPLLILADEPTGNLDNDMSNFVIDEMLSIVKSEKIALLMVTHNRDFIQKFDCSYFLEEGGLRKNS